ncbi:YggT family protein [Candidatus Roizmanbacteria bacterium]|nr:YggT family protein [Candidatus Roizmanbacteria bacterium]
MITPTLILGMLNLLIVLAEGAISLRLLLKLMGASTAAPFVRWVYETSAPLLYPFQGMFPSPILTGPFVIEFSAIFALFAYMFLGYILQEVISFVNQGFMRLEKKGKKKRIIEEEV